MKLLHSTPKADGFSMPGEFEPHQGCIMIWPDRADSWQYGGYGARAAFTEVATAISRWEPVTMLVNDAQYETARTMLPDAVRVVECSTDDAWARDIAPTFVRRADGTVRGGLAVQRLGRSGGRPLFSMGKRLPCSQKVLRFVPDGLL